MINPLAEKSLAIGIDVQSFSLGRAFTNVSRIAQRFNAHQTQIAHVNHLSPVPIIAAHLARVPTIIATNHTPALPFRYNLIGRFMERWALKCLHCMIVTSRVDCKLAQRQYKLPSKGITTIPYGLAPERFNKGFDRAAILEQLGIEAAWPVIGTLGRLAPQKAHRDWIQAAALIKAKLPDAKFLIAGEGILKAELMDHARDKGLENDVLFVGFRADAMPLMAALDIFMLSSRFEGLPFVILEAMALGKPIVSTAVDGIRDAIVDGKSGILVPPGQPTALAEAVLSLVRDPENAIQMGTFAQRVFRQEFVQSLMVERTSALYTRLITPVL